MKCHFPVSKPDVCNVCIAKPKRQWLLAEAALVVPQVGATVQINGLAKSVLQALGFPPVHDKAHLQFTVGLCLAEAYNYF